MVVVALVALVLPTKDSTGLVLLMLLAGDLVAVWTFRRHADWKLIVRLTAPVLAGLAVGAVFLALVDDRLLRRTIGVILLLLLAAGLFRGRPRADRPAAAHAYGSLAGFTTMVANAGGPPMNLYLLAARYDKWRFIGTQAWFFFAVNTVKLPVSIGLGLIRPGTAALAGLLVPLALLGAGVGRLVVKRLKQRLFEILITGFVAASALYLTFF
jgi:uncharacterized membrane protein YfcA